MYICTYYSSMSSPLCSNLWMVNATFECFLIYLISTYVKLQYAPHVTLLCTLKQVKKDHFTIITVISLKDWCLHKQEDSSNKIRKPVPKERFVEASNVAVKPLKVINWHLFMHYFICLSDPPQNYVMKYVAILCLYIYVRIYIHMYIVYTNIYEGCNEYHFLVFGYLDILTNEYQTIC